MPKRWDLRTITARKRNFGIMTNYPERWKLIEKHRKRKKYSWAKLAQDLLDDPNKLSELYDVARGRRPTPELLYILRRKLGIPKDEFLKKLNS